jgi:hypothetical protein
MELAKGSSSEASKHARAAPEAGDSVLVCKFVEPAVHRSVAAPMLVAAQQIQEVEAEGRRLERMASAEGNVLPAPVETP